MTITTNPSADLGTPIELPADGPVYVELDPRSLVPDPANVRDTVADLRGLTASIKAYGVLEPLVIKRNDDGHAQVVAGHRRQQAAIAAGQEQVWRASARTSPAPTSCSPPSARTPNARTSPSWKSPRATSKP